MTGPSPLAYSRSSPIGSRIGSRSANRIAASTPNRSRGRQRHFRREFRPLAKLDETHLAADRHVLGQIPARLTHDPDGSRIAWLAPGRLHEAALVQFGSDQRMSSSDILRTGRWEAQGRLRFISASSPSARVPRGLSR